VGHPEGTPAETTLPVDTAVVSAKCVGKLRSLWIKQPPTAADR